MFWTIKYSWTKGPSASGVFWAMRSLGLVLYHTIFHRALCLSMGPSLGLFWTIGFFILGTLLDHGRVLTLYLPIFGGPQV